jgi:S1-C subfamily serine protease
MGNYRNRKMINKIKNLTSRLRVPTVKLTRKALIATAAIAIPLIGLGIVLNNGITITEGTGYYTSADNAFPSRSFTLVRVQPVVNLESCTALSQSGSTKCRILMELNSGVEVPIPNMRSVGSGSVIGHSADRTFILTAKHVCEGALPAHDIQVEQFNEDILILGVRSKSTYELVDFDGTVHNAEIFRYHQTADICILETQGTWGTPIRVANTHPPEGAMVYNIAAPLGIFTPGMVPRWRGYYSGTSPEGWEFYSIPVAGGSSGSPVLYNNEIISIVVMSPVGFSNVAIGVSLEDLHDVIGSIQGL